MNQTAEPFSASGIRNRIVKNEVPLRSIFATALVMAFAVTHNYVLAIGVLTGYCVGSIYEINKRLSSKKK